MTKEERKSAEKVGALNTNLIVLKSELVKAELLVNRLNDAIANTESFRQKLLDEITK